MAKNVVDDIIGLFGNTKPKTAAEKCMETLSQLNAQLKAKDNKTEEKNERG